jgi:hypothetical protein
VGRVLDAWVVAGHRWVTADFWGCDSGQGWRSEHQANANLLLEAPFLRQGKQGKKIRQYEIQKNANLKIRHYESQYKSRSWGGLRR